jgi:hypothetical protein
MKFDRIMVGEQDLANAGVVQRRTTLQRFKGLTLGHDRWANENVGQHPNS